MSPTIPVPSDEEGYDEMATLFEGLHEQNMGQLGQVGIIAQQNFVTVSKSADYSYLQDKNLVSLTEAIGAREVGAKVTPAGPSPAKPE